MRTNRLHPVFVLFLVLGLIQMTACTEEFPSGADRDLALNQETGVSADAFDKTGRLPSALEEKVQRLRADLEKRGYKVARGYWNLFTIDDCAFPIRKVGNCYGNNPLAPYVYPAVPLWKDEFVDQPLRFALGHLTSNAWATYRLDEREAVVILGLLPPPGAYLGLQTYVYSRRGSINTNDPIYKALGSNPDLQNLLFAESPNPDRVLVFASMGNAQNNAVITRQSGAAFNEERSFLITPDKVMERAMTEALLRAGVPDESHIFTEPVSKELVRLGLDEEADDFFTLMRYALPEDDAAADQWRSQLPLAVLRVRDMNPDRPTQPYPLQGYDPRSAVSELHLSDELAQLVHEVKARWEQPDAPEGSFFSALTVLDLLGQHCLQRPMNCLGESQDTDGYRISPTIDLEGGKMIAVVGTLGTATGNATYTSIAVNIFSILKGVASLSHHDLAGSAEAFSGKVAHTDKFYVTYLGRDCTGFSPCLEISEDLVPAGEGIKLIQRNYLFPGSLRGAEATQMLNPKVIVLQGSPS